MSRDAFHHLLNRYIEGKCTPEEKKIVEKWYNLLDDEQLPELKDAEFSQIDDKLWNYLSVKIDVAEKVSRKTITLWPVLAVAASIIGILAIAAYFVRMPAERPVFISSKEAGNLIKYSNNSGKPVTLTLEDNSSVVLQPGAVLTYPQHFMSERREVSLTGEAFFEISKNKHRPFYVFSNNLITRVVGTSFIVKALNGKMRASEVAVLTGKVIVTRNEENRSFYEDLLADEERVELTPNYRAVYQQETRSVMVTLVENPLPLAGMNVETDFVYNNTPLLNVLQGIEKSYGIKIEAGKQVNKCTFTGDLTNEDLYMRMEFICQSIGATYYVEGTSIKVEGGSCK